MTVASAQPTRQALISHCVRTIAVLTAVMVANASADVTIVADPTRPFDAIAALVRTRRDPAHAGDPITVAFTPGTYVLDRPLVIPPLPGPITFAARGGPVVISGGRTIADWRTATLAGHACWAAEVPRLRAGESFRELWVNDRRALRARFPAHGFLAAVVPDATDALVTPGQTAFYYRPGDVLDGPVAPGAEAVIGDRWVESRLPIQQIDPATRQVRGRVATVFKLQDGDPFWLEGSPQWMTEPGSWYFDRRNAVLYYLPRPGEAMATSTAVIPRLAMLLDVRGGDRLTFRGLTFAHSEWGLPPSPPLGPPVIGGFAQAAVGVPAAVTLSGSHDCRFEACAFTHLGDVGIELGRGCQRDVIDHCTFTDLGAGGVKIGEAERRTAAVDQTFANTVSNCRVTDGGYLFPSACGIWVGQSYDNRISHNEIADLLYSGISVGWTWGYGPSLARGNVIEGNLVHHIGRRSNGDAPLLSDMGGLYLLGVRAGTVVRDNVFHDIAARSYGGWGIYLDEGSSDVLVQGNLVYRTTHGGFHQHYGRDNVVRNNVFALGRDVQIARTKVEPHTSFTFEHNIIWWDTGVFTTTGPSGVTFDDNLYGCVGQGRLKFGDLTWPQWQAAGEDTRSTLGDPKFVDLQRDIFTLRPDSPALRSGFMPLAVKDAGPR